MHPQGFCVYGWNSGAASSNSGTPDLGFQGRRQQEGYSKPERWGRQLAGLAMLPIFTLTA